MGEYEEEVEGGKLVRSPVGMITNVMVKLESFDLNVPAGYEHVANPDAEAHGQNG
jgi:hypothetical protein